MIDVSTTTVVPPAVEPIVNDSSFRSVHLKLDPTGDAALDAEIASYIDGLVTSARIMTEEECSRRWITQTVRFGFMRFPYPVYLQVGPFYQVGPVPVVNAQTMSEWIRDLAIHFPLQPIQSISNVQYLDPTGTLQTLDPSLYQAWLDHVPPLVAPASGTVWPATQAGALNAVRVLATVGYGDGTGNPQAVPATIQVAIRELVTYWYEHRGDKDDPFDTARSLGMPPAVQRLIRLHENTEYR